MRAFLLAATATASAAALSISGSTKLTPLVKGRPAADAAAVDASSLWSERGAIVFAVRRPG